MFLACGCRCSSLSCALDCPSVASLRAEAEVSNPSGLRGDVLWQLQDAEANLTQLGEAFPADKLPWRPGRGVRSAGEVLAHVASGNYYCPSLWGSKPPSGTTLQASGRS